LPDALEQPAETPQIKRRERRGSARASDPAIYEPFYGMQDRPFSLSADPRFLFHSAAHDRAAQAMLDAIRQREGVVVLTGPIGVGKTLLCRALVEQLDRRTLTSLVVDPSVPPEKLLKTVLLDFGVISAADLTTGKLARASASDLAAALRDFLHTLKTLQAFAVVIVDDAHRLLPDRLDQIRRLAEIGGEERLLQIILVGEPTLMSKIAKPDLRVLLQRVTVRTALGPLAADEVDGYLRHRLDVSGANPRLEFTSGAIRRVFELSRGVPRVVNLLCDRALTAGYDKSSHRIDDRLINGAAEDLDLATPGSRSSVAQIAGVIFALVVLAILGASAAVLVFQPRVAVLIDQWEDRPAPPGKPALSIPSPYAPTPAEQLERADQDLTGGASR
jgi:general secretion pathway protein A